MIIRKLFLLVLIMISTLLVAGPVQGQTLPPAPMRSAVLGAIINNGPTLVFRPAIDLPPFKYSVEVHYEGQSFATTGIFVYDSPASGLLAREALVLPVTLPGIDPMVTVTMTINPNPGANPPQVTARFKAGEPVEEPQSAGSPARDQSLEMFKTQWLPFAEQGEMHLRNLIVGQNTIPKLPGATLVLVPGGGPDDFYPQDLVEFRTADPLPMGWIIVSQTRGSEILFKFVPLPLGLGSGGRKLLPVDDLGEGSGQILILYMPVGPSLVGSPQVKAGVLRLRVNYPFWDPQPRGDIQIREQSEAQYNDGSHDLAGYRFKLRALGNICVFINGARPDYTWFEKLSVSLTEPFEQTVFVPDEAIRIRSREVIVSFVDEEGNVVNRPLALLSGPYPNYNFSPDSLVGWTKVVYSDRN